MKNPKGIDPNRLKDLMQSVETKKRMEEQAIETKKREEERKKREEIEKREKEEEEAKWKSYTFCAWHPSVNAEYTCESCNKRFCIKCLGEKKEDSATCKSCLSNKKYINVLKPDSKIQGGPAVKDETDTLIDSLNKETDPEKLIETIRLLGTKQSPKVVTSLLNKIDYKDEKIRCEIIKSLGKTGDPSAVLPLCNLLADNNIAVKKMTLWSLESLNDDRALDHLNQLLKIEKDPSVKKLIEETGKSLQKVREEKVFGLIRKLTTDDEKIRTTTVEELIRLGEASVTPLMKILGANNPNLVLAALEVLVTIGNKKSIEGIIPLLQNPDEQVRIAAVETLGRFKDETIIPHIITLQEDGSEHVRMAVIIALTFFTCEEIVNPLLNSLFDESDNVRKKAAETIAGLDMPEIASAMVTILVTEKKLRHIASEILKKRGKYVLYETGQALYESNDHEVQKMLLDILILTGDKTSIDAIKEFSGRKDIDKDIRNAAKDACNKIGKKLGLGFMQTITGFFNKVNKSYSDMQTKARETVINKMKKEPKKEVLPTCSVCGKIIRKQYPELKGEILWELLHKRDCEKCGKSFCPKCALQTPMGGNTTLISCPVCRKSK